MKTGIHSKILLIVSIVLISDYMQVYVGILAEQVFNLICCWSEFLLLMPRAEQVCMIFFFLLPGARSRFSVSFRKLRQKTF